MNKKTDLYEEFRKNYKIGDLEEYSIDLAAIHAFGITVDEMKQFSGPEYAEMHWSEILKLILQARNKVNQ